MVNEIQIYTSLLLHVKQRVTVAQQRAIYAANEELLRMYWDIGEMLYQSQIEEGWGKGTLEHLSVDLKNEFPKIKGFSVRNMQYMMQFFNEYNKDLTSVKSAEPLIAQPSVSQLDKNSPMCKRTHINTIAKLPVSQLPEYNFHLPIRHLHWTHNVILMQRVKDIKARYWYMIQCLTSHWSKEFLSEAIKLDYYGKHGALANNFDTTLPAPEAEYSLRDILKPIGISDYELGQALPKDLRSSLPSIEEIESEMENEN